MNVYQRFLTRGDPTYYGRWTGPDPDRPGHNKPYLRQLGTPNKEVALRRLKDLVAAQAAGRFQEISRTKARHDSPALKAVYALYRLRANILPLSAENNIRSLRAILRASGSRADWTDTQLDDLPSSLLTRSLVADFQRSLLDAAGADNHKQDSAAITANSYRRQARSIFRSDLLPYYKEKGLHEIDLKDFLSVKPLKEPPKYFQMPAPEVVTAIRTAAETLRETDPNSYRIFLLALGAGMRRNEIAHARWPWLETIPATDKTPERHQIRIQTTDDFRPKSRRDRLVPVEPFAHTQLAALRRPRIDNQPEYILDGNPTERCGQAFRRFGDWMKSLGWTRRKKAHELRKIFGSYVNNQAGLSAAQDLLGHSDPSITKAYYVDQLTLPQIRILG